MTAPRINRARSLRRSSTDAERRLWYRLRGGRLLNAKFRRQHPIGHYVADFACLESGLIVELDGSQHMERDARHDAQRTRFLNARGYTVLRFWNNDVLNDTESVLEAILRNLKQPLTPGPSPRKRGEGRQP